MAVKWVPALRRRLSPLDDSRSSVATGPKPPVRSKFLPSVCVGPRAGADVRD